VEEPIVGHALIAGRSSLSLFGIFDEIAWRIFQWGNCWESLFLLAMGIIYYFFTKTPPEAILKELRRR